MTRAEVEIVGTSKRAFTNQFGEYSFYGLAPGEYQVRASYTGMSSQLFAVDVQGGETARRDFFFRQTTEASERSEDGPAFELEEFEVKAVDSFQTAQEIAIQEERFSVNFKNVVDTNAYGIIAQGNVGEFVKFMPGVTIGYGGGNTAGGTYASGADANTISIRGFSARETTLTIDGVPMANAAPGTLDPAVGLDMLSVNNASRVEVIKVPSPDQPNAGVGGTVNLISKTAFEYPKPTLNYRVYFGFNTENLEIFNKTPGPMNEQTYKTLPGFDMTYAVPINDEFGFSLTLASSNQVNENQTLKRRISREAVNADARPSFAKADGTTFIQRADGEYVEVSTWLTEDPNFSTWQDRYGSEWQNWSEETFKEIYGVDDISRLDALKILPVYGADDKLVGLWSANDRENYEETLPLFYDEEGNLVGRVYNDWNHPYVNRVQVTDSPRISHRNSGALKFDWRPLDGLLVSANYQISTFEDQAADRRMHQRIDGLPSEYGTDYVYAPSGSVRLDTDAFSREGITHSGYVRASYMKGPWEISGHVSYSTSESDILSVENGHFSVIEVSMGGVDYTEFLGIDGEGVPRTINHFRDVTDDDGNLVRREPRDISTLDNYSIPNFDPDDPSAGTLRVNAAGINAVSNVSSAKFDVRRDLDFLPFESINLALKIGADWEERENTKSGRGINYQYVYLGQEGRVLSLSDFRDENYLNVEPGFNREPVEWPDPFALYDYARANPDAFSDTDDRVSDDIKESVAAHNYLEEANTSKSITETRTAYYAQVEGEFFNNRLTVVGGFRMGQSKREGYDRGENPYWNRLHFNRDADGNRILDVFENYDGVEVDPIYAAFVDRETGNLKAFDITNPEILARKLRQERVRTFEELKPETQAEILRFYKYYEEAGAVYPDGKPFIAEEFVPLQVGTLQAYKYQYIKNYEIDLNSQGRPQPIASVAYDVTDQLVARVSWSTTYSNPPYEASEGAAGTLRRVQFVKDPGEDTGQMNVSNPDLKISKTMGWDVGLSYYTESGGKYSITAYYRTEEDRAIEVTYAPNESDAGLQAAWEDVMRQLGHRPGSFYYENDWTVTTSVNAPGTYVNYGYELEARQDLSILGDWGKFFYVYGTFFQQFEDAGDVPEGDEDFYRINYDTEMRINASGGISFDYKRLNIRFNATWRNQRTVDDDPEDVFPVAIFWDDATIGNPGWYSPTEADDDSDSYRRDVRLVLPEDLRIDVSASFRLTDHYTLDFSARNITNSNPAPEYVIDGKGRLPYYGKVYGDGEQSNYGVNFTIGLSGSF